MEGREVKTVVFFDTETNCLDKPRITEICLMSVQREELLTTVGTPRVVNKVTLCINPQRCMDSEACKITGLYNDSLENQSPFDVTVAETLINFLSRLPPPVCLLAHNGNKFDFPLLLKELGEAGKGLSPEILCADSLIAFKDLDGYINTSDHPKISEGSTSQPTSRVTTPLDQLFQTTDLSSSLNLNRKTPIGQTIPETPCLNIKEKVRQLKRKCDSSFDRGPTKVKAVRKRLFETETVMENKAEKPESGNKNFAGSKPSTLEKLVSAKRFKPEVETVKKRLNFDSDDLDDEGSSDSSLNCSTDFEMLEGNGAINSIAKSKFSCDVNENLQQDSKAIPYFVSLDSQGSLNDHDFLHAVEQVESHVPTFGMNGLGSPGSPRHNSSIIYVPPTTNSVSCVTPVKGETTDIQTLGNDVVIDTPKKRGITDIQTTNETTPVKNTELHKSELKFTPVSQLARFTEKVKLNTPRSSKLNEQLKQLSASTSDGEKNHLTSFSAFVTASYSNTTTVNSMFNFQPKASYSLVNIYKRTFGCEPAVSHTAEDDCKALLQCVKRKSPDFIRWIDRNAVLLSEIQPLS